MARLPLPADDELPEDVRAALANLPPLNVFRMLGTLPAAFRPFLQLGGALLTDERIDPVRRETAILRVAHVTNAAYERAQHEQLARNLGMPEDDIAATAADGPVRALDDEGNLICRVADEISREVRLSDDAFAQVAGRYGNEGAASLILCVAYYNMVSRFLESTGVEIEDQPQLHGRTPGEVVADGP